MYTWDSSVIKLTIKLFNALTDTCEPLMVAVAYVFFPPIIQREFSYISQDSLPLQSPE